METSPASVVVIGDALIDEIRDESGSRDFVGGAALNVAVGLARLGVPTQLIAMVGDDADGAYIRAFLDSYGVELIATPGPLGSSRAVSDRSEGEPRYSFNDAAKNRRIEFGDAEREAIVDAALVVVSCFPFDDADQTRDLEVSVPDSARRLVIDPNPRSGMLASRERFVEGFERLAAASLLVKVGDEDAELLYGSRLGQLVERLAAGGAGHVLATAGRDGASVHGGDVNVKRPIAELSGAVIDTMGAGDATLASTVQQLVVGGVPRGADAWTRVLDRAMLIAAATCRHEGALLREP